MTETKKGWVDWIETTYGDDNRVTQMALMLHGFLASFGIVERHKKKPPITPGLPY